MDKRIQRSIPSEQTGEEPMKKMPLIHHLRELRRALLFCLISVAAAFIIVFFAFSRQLVTFVTQPISDRGISVIFTDVAEGFSTQMKLSVIGGIVCASPLIFGAIWWFIRPGLHKRERKTALIYIIAAAALFVTGVFFAYRYVFFLAVNFFIQTGDMFATPMLSIGTYVNFLLGFLPPFGIMFELPVLVIWLARLGLVTSTQMRKGRKYVILGLFTVAAVLTPPDVVSQVMLGLPLLALYEIGIICARVVESRYPAADS